MRKPYPRFLPLLLLAAATFMQPALAGTPTPSLPGEGGEGPEGMWWKNSEMVQKLGLSQTQVSQIEQIFYQHRLKLIDLHADVEKQEAMLQPLIEADQPDEAKVSAQLDQLLAARARLEKANTMMMLSIRRTLSVEQWKRLQALQQDRERREERAREEMEMRERREREMQERMRKERPPASAPRPPDGPPPASTPPPRPPDVPLF
jgi:Spy/CpxP family protein refolding chaperone